jgi:hypothetical protein
MTQKKAILDASNLPQLLSAVLAHPDLPERIYTGIADNLIDMNLSAQVNFYSPEMIELTLVAYATHKPKRQKRGERK